MVTVASGVFAQDPENEKAQRRERLKRVAEIGTEIAIEAVEQAASNGEAVSGHVITLQGKPSSKAPEVNNGGLVVVRIADSGSRPPKEIVVQHRKQFQRIGEVRGVAMKEGKPQVGGGFTWVLLKPTVEGEGEIAVSVTQHDGSKLISVYKVQVMAVEKVTDAVSEEATDDSK